MAKPISESDTLLGALHHVFLPPKLPQQAPEEKQEREINLKLVRLIAESVRDYKAFDAKQEEWNRMARMIAYVEQFIHISPTPDRLQRAMAEMEVDGQ